MVMASKQSAKANKMSNSESEVNSEKEVVEKKGGSDKPKRKAAAAASNANAAPSKVAKKRATKAEQAKEKKKEALKKVSENEDDSGSEGSSDDQKVPLLDQPLELSGARDRKQVDRFHVDVLKEGGRRHYEIEISEGKGTKLKDIPCIVHELKRSGNEELKTLHRILYTRIGNVHQIKDNILMFNGFSFDKNATEYRRTHTALSKLSMTNLRSVSQLLCLPKTGKQADFIERILEFLMKPNDSGKAARESRPERKGAHSKSYKEASADKEGGTTRIKRRVKAAKSEEEEEDDGMESENGDNENKEGEQEGEEEASDDAADDEDVKEEPPAKKTKRGAAKVEDTKKANKKVEEEQDIENGKEDIETEDKKSKKTSKQKAVQPKKRPVAETEPAPVKETTGRRQNTANSKKAQEKATLEEEVIVKQEVEELDVKEEPEEQETPEKKTKRPPTDDEIKSFVKTILDDANLEEITMKTVCKQVFEHFPDFDLSNKREFIKVTVKSFIS